MTPGSTDSRGAGLALLLLVLVAPGPAGVRAAPLSDDLKQSLVTIERGADGATVAAGMVVADGRVLTVGLEGETAPYGVRPWSGDATLVARSHTPLAEGRMVLLEVPGLVAKPLTFSTVEVTETLRVHSPVRLAGSETLRGGSVGRLFSFQPVGWVFRQPEGPELHLFSHNALAPSTHFGVPALDACGRVVGVSLADPRFGQPAASRDPQEAMVAIRAEQILKWLRDAGVAVAATDDACSKTLATAETAARQAREQAERERQQREEAERKAAEERREKERAEALAEQERQAREQAERKAAQEHEEREQARQQAEQERLQREAAEHRAAEEQRQRAEAERRAEEERRALAERNRAYAWSGAALLAAALGIGLAVWRRKDRQVSAAMAEARQAERQAQEALAEAEVRSAPFDCVLEGRDVAGGRYVLKLERRSLGDPEGVVIGRNPRDAEFVVAHEAVSREHARMYVKGETLYVEDLQSSNGTMVNGQPVTDGNPLPVPDGAALQLGPVEFRVSLKG